MKTFFYTLSLIMFISIIYLIIWLSLFVNLVTPSLVNQNEPIVKEPKNFNDYCDTHECLLGK